MSGKDIKGALNYNEQKVREGTATCIQASMFLKDPGKLAFQEKLQRFVELNERNQRTKTNTIHISLNFALTERLSVDKLNAIASTYMERIGFGDQPFLVYEHKDAAHQHIHILSTLIQPDGNRIEIHNLGRNQSEKARKEIEKEFYLVPATRQQVDAITPELKIPKPTYGKSETFRSISNIVRYITRNYKYTSLPELNAVLQQYNVTAYRGSEQSQMFAKNGLLYWMTTDQGEKIGVPIKASRIYGKPTMKFLERQFRINEALRAPHREALKTAIDQVLSFRINNKEEFIRALKPHRVDAIFRVNAEGRLYGLTLIDHRSKSVFKGSDLGKAYSANAIAERFGVVPLKSADVSLPKGKPIQPPAASTQHTEETKTTSTLLDTLFHTETEYSIGNVGKRKKKRRRRKLGPS